MNDSFYHVTQDYIVRLAVLLGILHLGALSAEEGTAYDDESEHGMLALLLEISTYVCVIREICERDDAYVWRISASIALLCTYFVCMHNIFDLHPSCMCSSGTTYFIREAIPTTLDVDRRLVVSINKMAARNTRLRKPKKVP